MLCCVLATLVAVPARSQTFEPDRTVVYKEVGDTDLRLHVFSPDDHDASDSRPAIVFFFGGGWTSGSPEQFYPQARYYADKGLVAMAAEYRIENVHGTTPFESVKDGKSAIRWVRANASSLGIDPEAVIASGGSAGGHVAAVTGTVDGFNEAGEDTSVSARPNAMVLFNPVVDNGPGGYGYDRIGDRFAEFSPVYNVDETAPPAITLLGTEDRLIPVSTGNWFDAQMEEAGVRHELELYEGQGHGFFNYEDGENRYFERTLEAVDWFLNTEGYLKREPIRPEHPIDLLEGDNLSKWYSWIPETGYEDPQRVFSMVRNIDGHPALRISGEEIGSLITKQAYETYHLIAEYRWGPLSWEWHYGEHTRAHRARDNGVQIHCQGADGNWHEDRRAPFMYGIQYQIREGRVGDFILMGGWNPDGMVKPGPELTVRTVQGPEGDHRYHWNGDAIRMSDQRTNPDRIRQVHWYGYDSNWINLIGYRGRGDLERPPGAWNRAEIIAGQDSIVFKLNGAVINVGTDPSVTSGKILLQSEYAEIFYRRLELRPLRE